MECGDWGRAGQVRSLGDKKPGRHLNQYNYEALHEIKRHKNKQRRQKHAKSE
jgi:hypothetical protein